MLSSTTPSRTDDRVAPDPEPEITAEDMARCDEMAAAIQAELASNDSQFALCSTQVYDYLDFVASPQNHHYLSRFNCAHFPFLVHVFCCADLPIIIRSALRALFAALEFFDPALLAELARIIVLKCGSFAEEMCTGPGSRGLIDIFAMMWRIVKMCGLELVPEEFLGFVDYCLTLPSDVATVPVVQQLGHFLCVFAAALGPDQADCLAAITWRVVEKIAEYEALTESMDLLFSIYSVFPCAQVECLPEPVFTLFVQFCLADLMASPFESTEVPDTARLHRGLRVFHFLFAHSHCSLSLADGYAIQQVFLWAFT
jgi:hypothetical protein